DAIALHHPGHDVVAANHPAEYRVAAIEMRLRGERDEPLRAAGIRTRQGHAEDTGLVAVPIDLVTNRPTRSPFTRAGRVAILDHEIGDDPVPPAIVEVAAIDQSQVIGDSEWCVA